MPYSYEFDEQKRLFRITIEGRDTLDDMQRRFDEITQHPDYTPGIDVVLDFRLVTEFDVSLVDAKTAVSLFKAQEELIGEGRLAIVANQDLIFGTGRVFDSLTADMPVNVRVFREMSEAEEWLGVADL